MRDDAACGRREPPCGSLVRCQQVVVLYITATEILASPPHLQHMDVQMPRAQDVHERPTLSPKRAWGRGLKRRSALTPRLLLPRKVWRRGSRWRNA